MLFVLTSTIGYGSTQGQSKEPCGSRPVLWTDWSVAVAIIRCDHGILVLNKNGGGGEGIPKIAANSSRVAFSCVFYLFVGTLVLTYVSLVPMYF